MCSKTGKESQEKDQSPSASKYSSSLSLGINMVGGISLFSFIGFKIDQKLGGGSGFTLLGIFLGLFYGGYEVWKLVKDTDK